MKLNKITFARIPALPGIRAGDLSSLDLDNPAAPLRGWRLALRGPSVFLISPPGWTTATQTTPQNRNPNGPVVVHQIPAAEVFFHWEGPAADIDALLKGGLSKFESQPFGPPTPVASDKPILEQIPPGQTGDA